MITTPSASIPTKSKPMPVSSLRVVVRCTYSMPATMTTAATAAPRYGEKSKTTAAAIPGSTPWTNASPKKLIPRRTSQTPTTDAITPAIRPPRSARCWKPSAKGSRNHSTGGSAQCVGDGRGVGEHHPGVGLGTGAGGPHAFDVQGNHRDVGSHLRRHGFDESGGQRRVGEDRRGARPPHHLHDGRQVGGGRLRIGG